MREPTNEDRAERARRALDYYISHSDPDADWHTALVDLLADLLHVEADQGLFCFDEALETARSHFDAECGE